MPQVVWCGESAGQVTGTSEGVCPSFQFQLQEERRDDVLLSNMTMLDGVLRFGLAALPDRATAVNGGLGYKNNNPPIEHL